MTGCSDKSAEQPGVHDQQPVCGNTQRFLEIVSCCERKCRLENSYLRIAYLVYALLESISSEDCMQIELMNQ